MKMKRASYVRLERYQTYEWTRLIRGGTCSRYRSLYVTDYLGGKGTYLSASRSVWFSAVCLLTSLDGAIYPLQQHRLCRLHLSEPRA